MKKLFFSILMAAATMTGAWAQKSTPTETDYLAFESRKTLVVLDDDIFSDFNMTMKEAVKSESWPTEVAFCKRGEFLNTKRKDPKYAFLVTTTVVYPDDKTKTKYTFLSLVLGKDVKQVTNMPDLISIPLAYDKVTDQKWACMLPAFMRFMLAHVEAMKMDPKKISDTPLLMYNKEKRSLSDKVLYLQKEYLAKDLQTEAAVKKVYPYKFKFVTSDEIAQAVKEKRSDVVFLHKVGPEDNSKKSRCFKILMGAGDAQIYYFDYHTISAGDPDALRAKDLKEIAKQ